MWSWVTGEAACVLSACYGMVVLFFFKQKTAYEMRISDWSSDVCSSDLIGKLMPFFHLPVQAGSDRILAAMNRSHSVDSYLRVIERVREARPDIAISGDFIVGFPGETEEDFEATLDIVRRTNYAMAYSFKYSRRPGTPAATMDDQIDEAVLNDRLQRLQDRKSTRLNSSH